MHIETRVLDEMGQTVLYHQHDINAEALIMFAREKEPLAREKGANWTMDGIPVFAKELIESIDNKEDDKAIDIDKASVSLVQMVWLASSIYQGLSEEKFINSDLEFTILHDGTVSYTRHEKHKTH